MKQRKATAVVLLAALLLTGCSLGAQAAGPDPVQSAAPALSETPVPPAASETPESPSEPDPETGSASERSQEDEQTRLDRLQAQQDGFLLDRGFLYAVDEEGNLRKDVYIGVLYFDKNGRYTSGSRLLDSLVAKVIRRNTDAAMTRMEKLKAVYLYTRDNIRYIGYGNHDLSYRPAHGRDGWMTECATHTLQEGDGNCYHFAAVFAALARGLGYQAYATAGVVGSEQQPHGWVEILDEDGNIWYCDPETEYSRLVWLQQEHDLFYKSVDDISVTTGLGYLQERDPFEAERLEAEEREHPGSVVTPEPTLPLWQTQPLLDE